MKKQIIPTLLVPICTMSPVLALTSCNKTNNIGPYDELSNFLKTETIHQFQDICKIPHGTFNTRQIADYIKTFAENLGFEPHEDNYRAPSECQQDESKSSGNIYFDIPATAGFNSLPKVILQGHMDMVQESLDDNFDWSTLADNLVIDNNTIHSKNYVSSIGADDGIGLSMILSIAKNHSKFNHGPIRVLVTADEEDGPSGAASLTAEILDSNYIMNIDGELFGELTKSCAGTSQDTFKIQTTWEDISTNEDTNQYTIKINNLLGGHSANDMNEGRASAIVVANQIIEKLALPDLQICQYISNNKNNAIASECTITFNTKYFLQTLRPLFDSIVSTIKTQYPKEKDITCTLTQVVDASKQLSYALTNDESHKLITAISGFTFGPYSWLDEKRTKLATSTNIGPLCVDYNQHNQQIYLETLSRSCYTSMLDRLPNINRKIIKNIYPSSTDPEMITTPCWEPQENDKLCDLVFKGYKETGTQPFISDAHGWLECAYFKQINSNAFIASIGANVTDSHSVKETAYINTFVPVLKTILYTLDHIGELN